MLELSDFEEVKLTEAQFREWQKLTTIRNNALLPKDDRDSQASTNGKAEH